MADSFVVPDEFALIKEEQGNTAHKKDRILLLVYRKLDLTAANRVAIAGFNNVSDRARTVTVFALESFKMPGNLVSGMAESIKALNKAIEDGNVSRHIFVVRSNGFLMAMAQVAGSWGTKVWGSHISLHIVESLEDAELQISRLPVDE